MEKEYQLPVFDLSVKLIKQFIRKEELCREAELKMLEHPAAEELLRVYIKRHPLHTQTLKKLYEKPEWLAIYIEEHPLPITEEKYILNQSADLVKKYVTKWELFYQVEEEFFKKFPELVREYEQKWGY